MDTAIPTDVAIELENLSTSQLARFSELLRTCNPRFALMLTLQSPPGSKCDGDYARDWGANGKQFESCPALGDELVKATRKFDPNFSPAGKVFVGGVMQSFDDIKHAWLDKSTARSDIKKLCTDRGMACSGMVETEGREPEKEPETKPFLADNIVEREAAKVVYATGKRVEEAREIVRDAMTPSG